MAPPSVARRIVLLVTSWRGTPTGSEDAVVTAVRTRLKNAPAKAEVSELQIWLAYGFGPLVDYALACFTLNGLASWSDDLYGERLYELFKVAVAKTKIPAKFDNIINDDVEWDELVRALVRHREGRPAPNPLYEPPKPILPFAASTQMSPRWWSTKWTMTLWGYLTSIHAGGG